MLQTYCSHTPRQNLGAPCKRHGGMSEDLSRGRSLKFSPLVGVYKPHEHVSITQVQGFDHRVGYPSGVCARHTPQPGRTGAFEDSVMYQLS